MKTAILMMLLLWPLGAGAVTDPAERLPDQSQEHRAERIGGGLRCLVCQNESIEESQAPLAHDLRQIVRQQVAAGQSDRQIMAWMVQRYGQFILLRPRFSVANLILWGSPALALLIALAVILFTRRPAAPMSLSDSEQARLSRLLSEP